VARTELKEDEHVNTRVPYVSPLYSYSEI